MADLVGQILWEGRGPVPAEEMEGIVLVDEIDLHLHPAWQVVLVRALKKVFPRLQFIATTHSPMVLPCLKREELFILKADADGNIRAHQAEESPALMTASGIYAKFFGLEEIFPNEIGEALWRYRYLAADPTRSDEEDKETQTLRQKLVNAGIDPGPGPVQRESSS